MNNQIQRSECLYIGEIIGIESIYTVINGKQINIPEKVEALREKGRSGLLQCPCGCGTKLILVASDRGLRQQHFRAMNGASWSECTLKQEGANSIDSKIIIKCWLADKIDQNIETRVPLNKISDTDRKYEVSHYIPSNRFAINYTNLRANLEDDKFEALDDTLGDRILHIVDIDNLETFGQYPEYMNKIQKRQNYCLFLAIDGRDYDKATLLSSFYMKNIDGLYQRIDMTEGLLKDYDFSSGNRLIYKGEDLDSIYIKKVKSFAEEQENEKNRRIEEKRREEEERKRREIEHKKWIEENHKREAERQAMIDNQLAQYRKEQEDQKRFEELRKQKEKEEEEKRLQITFEQLQKKAESEIDSFIDKPYIDDVFGLRWYKCLVCGKVAPEKDFSSYGGPHQAARGTCHDCIGKNTIELDWEVGKSKIKIEDGFCPICGSELVKRTGPYGPFWGCSGYPNCTYIKKIY